MALCDSGLDEQNVSIAMGALVMSVIPDLREPLARVWFLDVGHGDCTVVVDRATRNALVIDCPSGYAVTVKRLLERENAKLHTCIVTHWDADHYAGVARLAVSLPVSQVFYNHDTLFEGPQSPPYAIRGALKRFLSVEDPANSLRPALAGSQGAFGCVAWTLLAPSYHDLTNAYVSHKRNVASAVLDVRIRSTRILVGGDAVASTWKRLLTQDLHADILRWPHHGADLDGDSSGVVARSLIDATGADYVVMSSGSSNGYGHPSATVIGHLRDRGKVLCTQVTPGCFGFVGRADRNSETAREELGLAEANYCAGTIEVKCFEDAYVVLPTEAEHLARVSLWPKPMCGLRSIAEGLGVASN